jgi:ABC-2 type transport system ATP-binding protein
MVVETRGLTKYYGGRQALDHLDLSIPRGCIYGLLGRNGAGKTTAIKVLLGLMRPTCGRAWLMGCDSRHLAPAVRERVGYISEGHGLYGWMTIDGLQKFHRAFFPRRWDQGLFDRMLDYFDLSPKRKIKELSEGQRAQVSLALAVAPGPDLLIMDDPTVGLDTAIRRQFLEGMVHFIQCQGRSILFSSHILTDVERVADRIGILDDGVLRADCTLDEFRAAVKKAVMTFSVAPPSRVDIPGLLHERRTNNRLELTIVGTPDQDIRAWARSAGATECWMVAMNLEAQFIEFTSPDIHKGPFNWEPERHEVPSAV